MDPFTALIIASLLTWGTVGGGIKDTAAIAKGQTPPSHAYRMAKLQAGAGGGAQAGGVDARAAARSRRITVKDLVRHWWEDALEDADHWRQNRHKSRPERKAARKAWRQQKKDQVKRGYEVLKQRGEDRFHQPEAQEEPGEGTPPPTGTQEPEPESGPEGVPDNVIPLRTSDTDDTDPGPPEQAEPASPGQPADQSTDPTSERTPMIDLSDENKLSAHLQALHSYASYLDKMAADMDTLAAGMRGHQMGHMAVNQVTAAGAASSEAAARCRASHTVLEQAHTTVADARAANTDAADGDYLTRGK